MTVVSDGSVQRTARNTLKYQTAAVSPSPAGDRSTYSHSAKSATHISRWISCVEHCETLASASFLNARDRIRMPLPQVTEHGVHSPNAFVSQSAAIENTLIVIFVLSLGFAYGSAVHRSRHSPPHPTPGPAENCRHSCAHTASPCVCTAGPAASSPSWSDRRTVDADPPGTWW